MKLVIDIPEQMYINAKADMLSGSDTLVNAIKNGKPLPKGHWIVGEKYYMGERNGCCSVCEDYFTNDWFEMKYCPNCGCRMEGGAE